MNHRRRVSEAVSAPRALNLPRPVRVSSGPGGAPTRVDGQRVELVRESWLVEDRWWTGRPLRRRYWEVVSSGGRNLVVFHDLAAQAGAHAPVARRRGGDGGSGGWFAQAA